MNGEYKEYIELTAEVTARRLLEEFLKRLPCDKNMDRIDKVEKRMSDEEHLVVDQLGDIDEVRKTAAMACKISTDAKKAVNGLWWKVFVSVVVPLSLFLLAQKLI